MTETERRANAQLRRQRRLRGWSLDDVAAGLCKLAAARGEPEPGVNRNMVSRWERGVRTPRPHYVRLLCGLYDLPADELGLVSDLNREDADDNETPADRYYQLLVCDLLGLPPASIGLSDGRAAPVNRRKFLAYGAGVVGSTALDLEGLAAILNGRHPVDASRLGELRHLMTRMEQDYDTTAPRVLMPMVRGNLARLRAAKPPASETLGRQLHSLIGRLAVLAGRLSFRMHNIGEAESHYSLAEQLAAESGDDELLAFALAARSSLYSNIGSLGETTIALVLLDQAATLVGRASSPHLRGWLLAHRAEEHAALHDPVACYRDQDAAARALAGAPARGEGFFVNWSTRRLDGYRGCCAVELGEWQAAVGILERTAARTSPAMISQRSAILIDLATAYAGQHHIDHACELLTTTLDIASHAGLAEIVRRIITVRRHDLGSADTPSVRRLDEQLQSIVLAR